MLANRNITRLDPKAMKLNSIAFSYLVSFAWLTLFAPMVVAQKESVEWESDAVESILKKRIETDKEGVGIAVGIVQPSGKRVVGYGALRRSPNAPRPDGDTVFEIGSVTKVFTSLLLAEMVKRREVELSDSVSKFLPKSVAVPTWMGQEITLLNLASHTSALPRMPDNMMPADSLNPYADYSAEQMYRFLSSAKLTQEIGKKVDYSNLGAGLLGHALALRNKSDYEQLLKTRICQPLGMKDTAIGLNDDLRRRLAQGHDESLDETKNWDLPTLAGAGAIRSTVNDMLKFVEANMGKTKSPLSEAIELQHQTQFDAGSPGSSIALGWFKLSKFGSEVVWHNGQTGGYHSFVGLDKARGIGVVVLSNAATNIDDIGLHLVNRAFSLRKITPKQTRQALQVDAKILESYVGDYEIVPAFVISITKEKDQLMLQATGQPKFALFAESNTKFFLKVVDAQISFISDANGKVKELILHQGGANQTAKKK